MLHKLSIRSVLDRSPQFLLVLNIIKPQIQLDKQKLSVYFYFRLNNKNISLISIFIFGTRGRLLRITKIKYYMFGYSYCFGGKIKSD